MRIAVISDTHVGHRVSSFPPGFLKELAEFDAVIHCGDFTSVHALESIRDVADFYGVCGNMDDADVRKILPEALRLELGGITVGVMHGWGAPEGLERRVMRALSERYPDTRFDVILFGHSHSPLEVEIEGTKLFNPGSVAGNIFASTGSWGVLEIEGRAVRWELRRVRP